MFSQPPRLTKPGLFITATDTEVGKTVITCAIASHLRQTGLRVGVCKPIASECRREREGLVNEDAEALAHFADCRLPLDVINPIRFAPPVAPAVAAEQCGQTLDEQALRRSLERIDQASDCMLVEGVGGLLVPLDPARPACTVLDLIVALDYPVLVVTRSLLGTLNHTAMTVRLLRESGCRVVGLVMNGYDADVAKHADSSVATNRLWLEKMNGAPVLVTVPRCDSEQVKVHKGVLAAAISDAVGRVHWPDLLAAPRTGA